jgi:ribosome-associated translation inhibitor RaiA
VSTCEQTPIAPPTLPTVVELSGRIAPDLVDYVQHKIATVLRHTGRPALRAHVRVVRHADPARERPVTARASVELARVTLHVRAEGSTAREAADLLLDRLDRRISRVSRTRRGDRSASAPAAPDDLAAAGATALDATADAATGDRLPPVEE